jgi:hypothetical protein
MKEYFSKLKNIFLQESSYSSVEDPLTTRHYMMDNPNDLKTACGIIIDAIEEEINGLSSGENLVVIIGEDHANPAHILIQQQLLSQIQHHNPLYSFEAPADSLTDHWTNSQGVVYAPITRSKMFSSLVDMNTPIVFSDVHQEWDHDHSVISPEDPIAFSIAKETHSLDLNDCGGKVHTSSKGGFDIRNQSMVIRSTEEHKDMHSRLIIQHCGFAHLYGYSEGQDLYETSLVHHFDRANYKTLGIHFPSSRDITEEIVSKTAWKENPNDIIIEGLPTAKFDHLSHVLETGQQDSDLVREEEKFIKKLSL